MTAALISAGVGVLLGLGLLIWGLVERGKRAGAEALVLERGYAISDLEQRIKAKDVLIAALEKRLVAEEEATYAVRSTLDELREKLKASEDPKTVEAWLNGELEEQP